jgi:thioredoxin-related protein
MRFQLNKIFLIFTFLITICYTSTAQYYPELNPFDQIKNAAEKASSNNKKILVMIGGNWCIWCKAFDNLVQTDTSISNTLNSYYEFVHVNYSKENKNETFLWYYNYPNKLGFPVFLVLDNKGKLVHTQNSAYLEKNDSSKGHDAKLVLSFLNDWK